MTVSYCMHAGVGELLVCNTLPHTTCLLINSQVFNMSTNGGWWLLGLTINNVGFWLASITLTEFMFAQSPRPLFGIVSGCSFMPLVLCQLICFVMLETLFTIFPHKHVLFYAYLLLAFITLIYFILFHYTAKQYKLWKTGDIVPIHLFAEDYFEKESKGQRRPDRERGLWEKRLNMVQ